MEGKMPYDAVTHTMELAMNWFVVKVLKACLHLRSFHLVTGIIVTRSENTMLGFTKLESSWKAGTSNQYIRGFCKGNGCISSDILEYMASYVGVSAMRSRW